MIRDIIKGYVRSLIREELDRESWRVAKDAEQHLRKTGTSDLVAAHIRQQVEEGITALRDNVEDRVWTLEKSLAEREARPATAVRASSHAAGMEMLVNGRVRS